MSNGEVIFNDEVNGILNPDQNIFLGGNVKMCHSLGSLNGYCISTGLQQPSQIP